MVKYISEKCTKGCDTVIFANDMKISQISTLVSEFKKRESVYVPGRIFHSLTFRTSGKISITPEGTDKKIYSDKNCITYVPKGCSYSTEILEDGRMIILRFETENEIDELLPFVYRPTYPIMFENMFGSLLERYRRVDGRWDYSCLSMTYEILANLSHGLSEGTNRPVPKRMRDIKTYIDENFGVKEMNVSGLAKMCGISDVYFRREFRECFGASPIEYIKKLRIENAKGLLSTGMYSVSEAATRSGFDSISYFSYEFKRKCGVCPGDYSGKFAAR